MNTLPDHKPINQEEFRGLYSRGEDGYTVPKDFFSDCRNVEYGEGEVRSRTGSETLVTHANIVRQFTYKRLGETVRHIYLDDTGNLYDSLYPNNPIYTDASFVDFSMVNHNNRAYITPHNRQRGIPGKSVLVYEGSGTARQAGGAAPSGFTLSAVEGSASGNCEAGIHIVAVAYISSTGYITAPGPDIFAQVTSTGDKTIDVSNIPIGPSWVAGRILLATRSIDATLFTGNQYAYELYFVPGGTILDNTTTTLSISFYDADLVDSADYLIDNLASIPAGLGLLSYNGRLGVWAANGEEHSIRLSKSGSPETFDSANGIITIDPSEAVSGVRNCGEYRKNLIITKSNRLYGTTDNGDDPSTWSVERIDASVGTECFGIATVLDARGTNNDRMFIADRSGLLTFEGYVKRPELSFNIEKVWQRINKAVFDLVQVVDDPVNHRLYITVPLDSATEISHILFADYSKAFTVYGTIDEKQFKWAIWEFPTTPTSIVGDSDSSTYSPVLYVSLAHGIVSVNSGLTDDFGNAIDAWIKTEHKTHQLGWVNHFGGIRTAIEGSGSLEVKLYGIKDVQQATPPALTLNTTTGLELERLINFTNEYCSVRLRVNTFGSNFIMTRFELWCKGLWLRRPT